MMHHISDQEYCQLIEAEISRTESVIIKKTLFNKAILKKCLISFVLCCIGDLWSSFDHTPLHMIGYILKLRLV